MCYTYIGMTMQTPKNKCSASNPTHMATEPELGLQVAPADNVAHNSQSSVQVATAENVAYAIPNTHSTDQVAEPAPQVATTDNVAYATRNTQSSKPVPQVAATGSVAYATRNTQSMQRTSTASSNHRQCGVHYSQHPEQ